MLDIAKINPVLTSENDVANYSFLTDDGVTYVIMNDLYGDDAYTDDYTIKAGEYLNGYDISAWVNQELVIDAKHIDGTYANITAGTTLLTIADDGGLEVAESAPESGLYFKVTAKTTLTEQAVKARVMSA